MQLIITRHAETIDNQKEILSGSANTTFSKQGFLQLNKLKEKLKSKKIDLIYTNQTKRAIDTASQILSDHPNTQIKQDDRLRDRDLGKYQGQTTPKNIDWYNPPPGIESNLQVYNRTKDFLKQEILNNPSYKAKSIFIVTSGPIVRALLTILNNKPFTEFHTYPTIENARPYFFRDFSP